jgi:hypothetical protein
MDSTKYYHILMKDNANGSRPISRRAEFFQRQPKISHIYSRLAVSRRKKMHGLAAVKCSAKPNAYRHTI